ncbi:hypothetical protein ACYPKM_04910 [Pseudomonas aeruginosa]
MGVVVFLLACLILSLAMMWYIPVRSFIGLVLLFVYVVMAFGFAPLVMISGEALQVATTAVLCCSILFLLRFIKNTTGEIIQTAPYIKARRRLADRGAFTDPKKNRFYATRKP